MDEDAPRVRPPSGLVNPFQQARDTNTSHLESTPVEEPRKKRIREFLTNIPSGKSRTLPSQSSVRAVEPVKPVEEQVFAPQIEIQDGKVVVAASSLVVTVESMNQSNTFNVVHENESEVPAGTYHKTRTHSDKWSPWETKRFYDALSICGTDFELMQQAFPKRSRGQMKKKFKREEKDFADIVQRFLDKQYPLSYFDSLIHTPTGEDWSPP